MSINHKQSNGYQWHPSTCYVDDDHLQADEEMLQDTNVVDSFAAAFCQESSTQATAAQVCCPSRPLAHYSPIDTVISTSSCPAATTTTRPAPRNNKQKTKSKADSGLRRFSQDVLEEVKQRGVTSFDEVADEMFRRLSTDESNEGRKKNVRRRVYDILNVLVAMNIVSKDRKEITWLGLPAEIPEEQLQLQQEKEEMEESIQKKTAELQHLITQQLAYKNLLANKMESSLLPQTSSVATAPIHLPFIAVRTSKKTVITHATSKDNLDHVFNFDQPFQIHDNMEVLMRMGMAFGLETNTCSQKNLEISRTMVSKELHPYLEEMAVKGHSLQNHKKMSK